MKKKKILIYSLIFIVLLAIALGIVFFLDKVSEKGKSDKQPEIADHYSFEKRMKFAMPEYAEVTILDMKISDEEEAVYLKFTIPESEVDSFVETLNTADYYEDSDWGNDYDFIPHPERASDKWDMDYKKLDKFFMGFNTRISSKYKHRLHINIYFLKPENGKVTIYLCYNG